MQSRTTTLLAALVGAVLAAVALLPAAARADTDPAGCTDGVQYDPTVPRWDQVFASGDTDGAITPFASGAAGRSTGKNPTVVLDRYFDAVTQAVANSPRVRVKEIAVGQSELGGIVGNDTKGRPVRRIAYWVVGTPEHVASFEQDGRFWADVRDGRVSEADGLAAARTRPSIGWVTATPHGNEPAAGEAIARQLYELVARLDCTNARRLANLDLVLDPVRNPDGRDNNVRTTAWGFDPNRDFGVRNYKENTIFLPEIVKYPGLFFIDAHQKASGYFFPPNEDPVHHEISDFSLGFINDRIGPALQRTFNDQSAPYQNYDSYDLFTPEYGDTVPSLLMGAAGMTYEKGVDEAYGKQVYDHYLAIDTTINLTSKSKVELQEGWVRQWSEAIRQGQACQLQPNKLVSPLHETINQQPDTAVCGYFFRPGLHEGDVARLMKALREVDVRVFSLDRDTAVTGLHEYGRPDVAGTLPKGTLYIPMAQAQKHWIQSVLGENPFIPYNYYYDVVTWSYGLQRGLAGDGFLTSQLPADATMSPVDTVSLGSVPSAPADVYAWDTDSMEGLGLVFELLHAGVNVYRGTAPFDAGGTSFDSGAAMVDAASLTAAGVDLAALAAKRNTPVTGLDGFPVTHKQLVKPKVGVYTGTPTDVPTNPLTVDAAAVRAGTATSANDGQCTVSTAFCEALFGLTQKQRLPASAIVAVTRADVVAGRLASGGFTALVNPGYGLARSGTDASVAPLQAFVNGGGRYLGYDTSFDPFRSDGVTPNPDVYGGTLTAAYAGFVGGGPPTPVAPAPPAGLLTPGSTFDATFDTTDPVAWGFDRGGWIYRDSSGNAVYSASQLGTGKAVVSFAQQSRTYGYSANAGTLGGRPAVIDHQVGSGHAVLVGFDPYFRSWKDQDDRLMLNAAMLPTGAEIAPSAPSRRSAAPAVAAVAPAAAPVRLSTLPKPAKAKPVRRSAVDRDVLVRVARRDGAKLRRAVRAAKLRKALRKRVGYRVTRGTVTLVVRGARRGAEHDRAEWASRILRGLERRHVRVRLAQL